MALELRIKDFPLSHFNPRPNGAEVSTLVIHSMYAKDSRESLNANLCFKVLDQLEVSAHFSIARDGTVWRHVDPSMRAWHAGESNMPKQSGPLAGRDKVNDFSVGIEMIGIWGQRFRKAQYRSLLNLVTKLLREFPIKTIVSHQAIAPQRKVDPGPSFRWDILRRELGKRKLYPQIIP